MPKQRADQLVVAQGLAESRARAQALILAGLVRVRTAGGDAPISKAGQMLDESCELRLSGKDHPWVSRGGIKLDHALSHFGWDVVNAVAIDVGASTGGFTHVLLSRGAAMVYAVDSGTNQLAWSLRTDPRVRVHEQTSARTLTAAQIDQPVDLVVCDASFIALSKVLPVPLSFAAPGARLIALIKPQFEAARGEIGKKGVVRDPAVHARICADVARWLADIGWPVAGIVQSPITGPEGNIEFLIAARRARAVGTMPAP